MEQVQVLLFDVFGTVVDWRSSVIAEGKALAHQNNLAEIDWAAFADQWRSQSYVAMARVRRGELSWTKLDEINRLSLIELLAEVNIKLSKTEIEEFSRVWHRLQPWTDSVGSLTKLRTKFVLGTLSNGNVSLLTNLAKHAHLPWDVIISAEHFRHYKPDVEVYRGAAELLSLLTSKIALVAAHNSDLVAAAREGYRTVFVARPTEYGPNQKIDLRAEHSFDMIVDSLEELADRLVLNPSRL